VNNTTVTLPSLQRPERLGVVIDVRNPTQLMVRIKDGSRRLEKGRGVPNATRQLLVEANQAIGDRGPLEMGISPRRWRWAQEDLNREVERRCREELRLSHKWWEL
jgi:hypothetical protein